MHFLILRKVGIGIRTKLSMKRVPDKRGIGFNVLRNKSSDWFARYPPENAAGFINSRFAMPEAKGNQPTRERIALDPSVQPLPQTVVQDDYNLWAAGSLDRLRQRGVTHIVISSSNFARFYDRFATYSNEALERKKFYDEIFATLVPIHEEDNSSDADIILFSRILVYDIRR